MDGPVVGGPAGTLGSSVLTLILLVILGGGVGILAVSMAEGKPAMRGGGSRRARVPEPVGSVPVADPPSQVVSEPSTAPLRQPTRTVRRQSPGLPRRTGRGDVPATQTAVEGPLGDLVRPSIARRVASLVGIVCIAVVVGVGIAALLGAVVGGAAEIVGNTIG